MENDLPFEGVTVARLQHWLAENLDGFVGPLIVDRFPDGQSNPTYKLTTPPCTYVLRKKPCGEILKGAHAIEREVKVIGALQRVGFPVAAVRAVCVDEAIVGTGFYVMEYVQGRVFWDPSLAEVPRLDRPAYFGAMNSTLARLHSLNVVQMGLENYGRAGNYLERQIARWGAQYRSDTQAGRNSDMDKLVTWLEIHIPEESEKSGCAVVHGDYRCDNLMFHESKPTVLAVLDWELSTLGNALADFAYHALMYRMPPHIIAGLKGLNLSELNIPAEHEYVEDYCARVGRAAIPNYGFYMTFSFFRLAAIFHGIKGRVLRGTASSPEASKKARHFDELASLGWSEAQKAEAR